MKSHDARIGCIREAIETYLSDHPEAADTCDGVLSFWLAGAGSDATLADVVLALGQLVDDGRIVKRGLPGGALLYERPHGDGGDTPERAPNS